MRAKLRNNPARRLFACWFKNSKGLLHDRILQRLQIEQSEKRQRVHVLLEAGDTMTDEQRAELATLPRALDLQTIETEISAPRLSQPRR